MNKDITMWIVKKRKNFTVLKLVDGKRVQVAKFKNKSDAEKYRDKFKVAAAMDKVVEKEYSFHELFMQFADTKREGGRNIKSCMTISGGARYASQFENYIKPNFPDCPVHTIGGAKMQEFVDAYLGSHKKGTYKPERYKTTKNVLANMRRFFRWCITMQYHSNFQSAIYYRIPEEQKPRQAALRSKVKATVIHPKDAARLLKFVWDHREDSANASLACMIFHMLFYFGFRRSELLGLRKTDINLEKGYVDVAGKFDFEHYTYSTETKNAGSKRKVFFDPNGDTAEVLSWILEKSWLLRKDNDYLIPAITYGPNPLSDYQFRKILYATYEIVGLAELRWKKDPKSNNSQTYEIVSCPFKGCTSKTWRHLKAAQLIQNRQRWELSDNYIKRIMGHDLFSTTRDIYGDHDLLELTEHHDIAAKIEQLRNQKVKLISK
jgi:integrase